MPSFDAPVEFPLRRSPRLLAVRCAAWLLGFASCLLALPGAWRFGGLPALLVVMPAALAALASLCQAAAQFHRAAATGAADARLRLDAAGRLQGRDLAGTPVDLTVDEISLRPGLIVLHVAAGTDEPCDALRAVLAHRPPRALHLARDAIPADAFRRLRAWSRFALPSVVPPGDSTDVGARS